MTQDIGAHHPLRLLAAAVVGRPVSISYLVDPAAAAWTDGERIYLPGALPAGECARALLVQCALLAGGAMRAVGLRTLVGSIELRERFLVLEVERCCRLIESRLPGRFLEALSLYGTGVVSESAEMSLQIAAQRKRLPAPPTWFGTVKPWRIMRQNLQGTQRKLNEQKLSQLESRISAIEDDAPDDDEDALKRSPFWKLFSSPLGKDGLFARFMQEIFDMQSSPDKDSTDSGVEGSSEMVSGRAGRQMRDITNALRSSRQLTIPSALMAAEGGAHRYPEWDCEKQAYRTDWTCVEEVAPNAETPVFDIATLASGVDRSLQRTLARLCLGFRRHSGQRQGEDLVLDPLVRLAVDLRSGHSGDERIYSSSLPTRRDLGVLILLDTSSSTLESTGSDRVFDRQAQAAWRLCRSFDLLGDRVAMYGFHSWGRTLVRFQHLKTFDEALGAAVPARMGKLSVAGYTRCGAAIRHASSLLNTHAGTPYKLMLLVSDGFPYDDQYEGRYASEDTRKALEEAASDGVACLCLSIGSDADRARLVQAYGHTHFLAIGDVAELATRLRGAVEKAVAAASRIRRVSESGRRVA